MDLDDFIFFHDDYTERCLPSQLPLSVSSPLESIDFAAPAAAPGDAVMVGVNAAAAPVPVAVGGGGHAAAPCCATAGTTTEIQHHVDLEEEDARRRLYSWELSDVEQCLLGELDPLAAPDEKLVEAPVPPPPPAPEDGRPSCRDADDMPEVNEAAPPPAGPLPVADVGGGDACATSKHFEEEAPFSSFKSAIEQELHDYAGTVLARLEFCDVAWTELRLGRHWSSELFDISTQKKPLSIVGFTGPDSKGRKPHQGGWKEKSMTGMRAVVADLSWPPLPASEREKQQQQQQRYVGLKKTLELDDDGNGDRWRAYEYTPLLPPDDGTNKLVHADVSLRVEFKVEEPPPAFSLPSKRSRSGAPKDGPKVARNISSPVWEHMTKVHVEVAANNADGSQSKRKPRYKVMLAICHHCDRVFNADSNHGRHNLSNHLETCGCNCTHSH